MTSEFIDRPQPHEQRVEAVIAAFREQFGRAPEGIAEAPGRVNLIGEHVDYNDGLVLPFAIDRSVMCAWAFSDDEAVRHRASSLGWDDDVRRQAIRVHSSEAQGEVVFLANTEPFDLNPDDERHDFVEPTVLGDWDQYVHGVAYLLSAAHPELGGIDLSIAGDVPPGAGLSSSAALEVAVAGAMRDAFALPLDDVALALLCQRAENEYAGVQSGIMDQFASTLSRAGHALLLDCRSLAVEHVPLRLDAAGLAVVIVNSGVSRDLISSVYNERRWECNEAVVRLRTLLGRPDLGSLRDVTPEEVASLHIDALDVPYRRARHVVTEIARVEAAVAALRADDFAAFGALMAASHASLRDDYAVSSPELDLLVGLAQAQPYVLGARLTGAGFGGCTVNLVRQDALDAFARDVIAPYRGRTGLPALMYVTAPQDGLRTWRP